MRLNIAIPENQVKKPVLDAGLEAVTRLNESLIKEGAPTFQEAGASVRWKPEPPGGEFFDHVGKVLGRGHGDCDDLAPWHAASLRATGEDKGARAIVKRSGPKRWHAVVKRSDGSIDDPSISAGMPGRLRDGARAPVLQPMVQGCSTVSGEDFVMPHFAARPVLDQYGQVVGFDARVDIPWHHTPADFGEDIAMATLHSAPVATQAVVGALAGASQIAHHSGLIDDGVIDRVDAIREWVEGLEDGADPEELMQYLEDKYGPEHAQAAEVVGAGFFKSLGRIVKKVALPIASKLVQFIPGVGPVASTAIDMGLKGIDAATKAGGRRKRRRSGGQAKIVSPMIAQASTVPANGVYQPSPAECARILAQTFQVSGDDIYYDQVSGDYYVAEDDGEEFEEEDEEVGRRHGRKRRKFRFGKVFKKILMPHTLITDRIKSKAMRRILDPSSFIHEGKKLRRGH